MNIHERVDRIIASYEGGATTATVAADHEISIVCVREVLRLADVGYRRGKISNSMCAQFRQEYEAGSTTPEIAVRHGVTAKSVGVRLRGVGVNMRQGGRPSGPTPKIIKRVTAAFRLRAEGKTWREVADDMGFRSTGTVQMACYRHPELVP